MDKDIQEGELIEGSRELVIETKAVNLTPAQMEAQVGRDKKIRAIVTQYINENLKEGLDYGSIEIGGKMSKPTLFKPGSEKFCSLFKIRPVFKKDTETVEMLGSKDGVVAYLCELYDGKGQVVGEGRGVAVVDFSKGDFNVNKQVKLAEKRAQIDAVLRTGGLSDFFTQDIEDMPHSERQFSKPQSAGNNDLATDAQKDYFRKLCKSKGFEPTDYPVDTWTKKEISEKIQELK